METMNLVMLKTDGANEIRKKDYLNTLKELTACNERESDSLMGLSDRCAVEV